MFSFKPRRAQLFIASTGASAPVLLAALLAGCTPQPAVSEKAASAPASAVSIAPAASAVQPAFAAQPASAPASAPALTADEQAVMKRAQERWDALVARDFERAWTYLQPAAREKTKQQDYKAHFGDALVWKEATARNAKCLTTRCGVFVRITSKNMAPNFARQIPELTSHMTEEWVKEEGQWWYKGLANLVPKDGEEALPSAALPKRPRVKGPDSIGSDFGP